VICEAKMRSRKLPPGAFLIYGTGIRNHAKLLKTKERHPF
jgi:hypothetical protein